MPSKNKNRWLPMRRLGVVMIAIILCGCAAERLSRNGMSLIDTGNYESGLDKLEQAAKVAPSDFRYRVQFLNKRDEVVNRLLSDAERKWKSGHLDEADDLYHRVLTIAPENRLASDKLDELTRSRYHQKVIDDARASFKKNDWDDALIKLRPVLNEDPFSEEGLALKREIMAQQAIREAMTTPALRNLYKKPVTLEFRDANLKMVFDMLSRTSGINFILDKDVRPDLTTTISIKRGSLESAVDLLLTTNQLEKKILDSNTVLIYPNKPEKAKEYQELVIKSFYIENSDVKQTMNMVKTLLKTREIFVDEKLNLMIMRDTPETIRLAEKLIAMQDLAEPEVMLEMEVLEVKRSRLLDLGVQYPTQLAFTPLAGTGGAIALSDLRALNSNTIGATVGSITLNAQQIDGNVNLLANPRIRTRNREKASIMIGDKVPVITTTSNATGFVSDSVQYVDVGLKLELEPNVYLNNEVAIKVSLEVSSIVNQFTSQNGTLSYQIGTRDASTVLRLKDGETQVLAGLINDSDRSSINMIPGLGSLPLLGRLFSYHDDNKEKTEIVLSITPHLIRTLKRPDASASEFWSGTENSLRTSPFVMRVVDPVAAPPAQSTALGKTMSEGAKDSVEADAAQVPTAIGLSWDGPNQIKQGEQFQLVLKLKANGGLLSMPFQMSFDPAVLKVVSVEEGEYFRQNNGQTHFTSNVDVEGGRIYAGVTRVGVEAATGEGSLAVITFKALPSTNSKAEVKLLGATPVGNGGKMPVPEMPDTYSVNVVN